MLCQVVQEHPAAPAAIAAEAAFLNLARMATAVLVKRRQTPVQIPEAQGAHSDDERKQSDDGERHEGIARHGALPEKSARSRQHVERGKPQ